MADISSIDIDFGESGETLTVQHKNIPLMEGESGGDEIDWHKIIDKDRKEPNRYATDSPANHIDALAWKKDVSQKGVQGGSALGTLLIRFATGGYVKNEGMPIYAYFNKPYNTFYRIWKEVPNAGKYVYHTMAKGKYARVA